MNKLQPNPPDSLLSFQRKAAWYLGTALFLVGLQTVVLHRLDLAWCVSVTDSVVSVGLLALLVLVVSLMHRYYQPGKENRAYVLVFLLVDALIYCLILHYLMQFLLQAEVGYLDFLERSMPVRFLFVLQGIAAVAIFYYIRNQLTNQKEMEHRRQESEQLMREAELARLRQQLHPHFLFNSLNSINALVGSQPEAARKMTQQLSDFLRGTLRKEDTLIPLSEELDHLRLYLEIEKVRFGSRLQVNFLLDQTSLMESLPSLLLQPIMENAIKYGLYDVVGEVHIVLQTRKADGFLQIQISNPFDPAGKPSGGGAGFGLASVRRRLQLLYSRPDLLHTSSNENTFSTLLKIPLSV